MELSQMANFFVAGPQRLGQHIGICLPRPLPRVANFIHLSKFHCKI